MRFFTVPGDQAFEKAISSVGQKTRYLFCGHPDDKQIFLTEAFEDGRRSAVEILSEVEAVTSNHLLENAKTQASYISFDEQFTFNDFVGHWESVRRYESSYSNAIAVPSDARSGKPIEQALMAEIRVEHPWEVLAHFQYRIWYESWKLKHHCAIWRYWYETYDAHVICVTPEYLEAVVYKPPRTRENAVELAWEHFYYCSDMVDVIAKTAVLLLNSDSWSFWWD